MCSTTKTGKKLRKMAFEERNGNYYYYKKERDGKRVVSTYYGKGETAGLIAQLDELYRFEAEMEAEKQRKNREKDEKIDRDLLHLESEIKKMTEIYLLNIGFYKTKSREWRIKKK